MVSRFNLTVSAEEKAKEFVNHNTKKADDLAVKYLRSYLAEIGEDTHFESFTNEKLDRPCQDLVQTNAASVTTAAAAAAAMTTTTGRRRWLLNTRPYSQILDTHGTTT